MASIVLDYANGPGGSVVLPLPPSANHIWRVGRTGSRKRSRGGKGRGRPRLVRSHAYEAWRERALPVVRAGLARPALPCRILIVGRGDPGRQLPLRPRGPGALRRGGPGVPGRVRGAVSRGGGVMRERKALAESLLDDLIDGRSVAAGLALVDHLEESGDSYRAAKLGTLLGDLAQKVLWEWADADPDDPDEPDEDDPRYVELAWHPADSTNGVWQLFCDQVRAMFWPLLASADDKARVQQLLDLAARRGG